MSKPIVTVRSHASRWDDGGEQTVEFSAGAAADGGLIEFRWDAERQILTVTLYRLDPNVEVIVPEENLKHE